MIRGIVEFSLRFRHLIIALAVVIMVYGLFAMRKMPVEVFPEFEPPLVEIQTEAAGLSAEEVESLVTMNVEEILSGTPFLESMHSESIPGLSSVILTFKPGTPILRARQFVQEALTRAYMLPNVSKPPVMLQPLSATRRAMMVGLTSTKLNPMQISVLAQWTIKPRLMGVPGVANVVIWGQKNRQLQVQIDPVLLQKNNITQEQVIRTTGDSLWFTHLSYLNASVPGSGGWIETPNQRLAVRHVLPISKAEDLSQLPIYGSNLRLSDVATVVEGYPPLIGEASIGDDTGIILVIEKFPWANTLEVTKGVTNALQLMKVGLPDIQIDTQVFQLANFISGAIDNLAIALLMSAILIALTLWLLFFHWRTAFISFVTIPISLVTAAIILYWMNISINMMVLTGFGIALAMMLDDSIVDLVNIIKRLRENQKATDKKSLSTVIVGASLEVRKPIIYATIVVILAILPVIFLSGFSGAFFKPLVYAYSFALFISGFVAFTLTPTLAFLLLKNTSNPIIHELSYVERLKGLYDTTLQKIIDRPQPVYIATLVILIAGVIIWAFMKNSLLPTFKERDLLIEIDSIPSASQSEVARIVRRMSDEIDAIPGVHKVAALSGRAIFGDSIVNVNSSQLWANIDPSADYEKTLDAVKTAVSHYPGLEVDVQTYLRHRIRKMLSGENEDIVIRINGPSWEILRETAEKVKNNIKDIEGIADLVVEGQEVLPQIEVKVDLAKATPLGIKPGDVRRAAATIFAGIETGSLFESQKVFEVVVWSIPKARNSLTDVQNLMIDKPGGGYVRLGDIAEVRIVASPTVINHEAITPYIDIVANVKGQRVSDVEKQVEEKLKEMTFPAEHHPQLLGEYKERQAAKRNLCMITLSVLIIIYLTLQACFNSWRIAALAFIGLPVGIVGGVFATLLTGATMTLGPLVGFLAILGISVRHGILLIHYFQQLQYEMGMPLGSNLIKTGVQGRLIPILMTTITTFVGLLPFVFLGAIPGLEVLHPMAVVVLGGLVTSTLLNLFIIPPLYLWLQSKEQNVHEKIS